MQPVLVPIPIHTVMIKLILALKILPILLIDFNKLNCTKISLTPFYKTAKIPS
jgi:hypothetical protein